LNLSVEELKIILRINNIKYKKMKKALFTLFAIAVCYNGMAQDKGQARPNPMMNNSQPPTEIIEYAQLKFKTDVQISKITDVVFFNGFSDEKFNHDFRSLVEVLNLLGRRGWNYISENQKDEKGIINYTILLSRKISFQNRMDNNMNPQGSQMMPPPNQPNQPTEEQRKKLMEESKQKK
jgi:hypothetical protein